MRFVAALAALLCPAAARDAGILYEVWHTYAAQLMAQVAAKGLPQLTVEKVLRSDGRLLLDDVYKGIGQSGDIYNVEPQGGFYCLYRKRPQDVSPPLPDCANISGTAARHAAMLSAAGFDYVAVDITNWPKNDPHTDAWVTRPTEVLFEEWAALRKRGLPTPQIAVWPCVSAAPGGNDTWRHLLDTLYNNPQYDDLLYKRGGKKVVFLPYRPGTCYDDGVAQQIEDNGGRKDVTVVKMWALFGEKDYKDGVWGFFSPCRTATGSFTTSMVGVGDCDQGVTQGPDGTTVEISASGSYMVSQTALPFAAAGHLRGLTLQRLFKRVLAERPPSLFMSSFNEHIGGRQAPAGKANTAFNMGLPDDPQRASVWVDSYGSEFTRDMEPSAEGGGRVWEVAASCVQLYKAGKSCSDAPGEACCTVPDKAVFANAISMRKKDGSDTLLTPDAAERDHLRKLGWTEVCNPFPGPSAFCVDTAMADGRAGPFMLYSAPQGQSTRPLFRCLAGDKHFVSIRADCEGQAVESTLGHLAVARGGETLRALRRCYDNTTGVHSHALDLKCDHPDGAAPGDLLLGFVR